MKNSRNLCINNSFYTVKTDNDRRYIGLVATRNKIIKLLHESTKKGDPVEISVNLCIFILCVFDIDLLYCFGVRCIAFLQLIVF